MQVSMWQYIKMTTYAVGLLVKKTFGFKPTKAELDKLDEYKQIIDNDQ